MLSQTLDAVRQVYMYDISAEAALERIQKAYDTRGGLGASTCCIAAALLQECRIRSFD